MFKTPVRLSQIKTPKAIPSITTLKDLPTNTGAGLFIEYPKFEPMGSMLHITLPSSSVLSTRTRSVVAINGDLGGVEQKLSVLNLWSKPLIYNQITSTSPLSLLLSSKGFMNLEMNDQDKWNIIDTDSLVCWFGSMEFNKSKYGLDVNSRSKGNLILNGSDLFIMDLEQSESTYVSPGSLIAYKGEVRGFHKLDYGIPRLGLWDLLSAKFNELAQWVKSFDKSEETKKTEESTKEDKQVIEYKEETAFDELKHWISLHSRSLLLRNRLFYQIQGPATLIIRNEVKPHSRVFTKQELAAIYKELK
jgi:hypothetical protein